MRCPVPALSPYVVASSFIWLAFLGERQGGQAVSASRCVAVHRCVLHKGWERSCTCSYVHQHEPQVLLGHTGAPLPWRTSPSCSPRRHRAVLSPSRLAGRALWAPCAALQSHHAFFFRNRDLCSQTKSPSFTLCHRSFLPLEKQHR